MKKLLFLLIVCQIAFADTPLMTLQLQHIALRTALQMLAEPLKVNMMLSPNIHGVANLQLQDVKPDAALAMLLRVNGLGKWQHDNILYIAPQSELLTRQQADAAWQATMADASPLAMFIWHVRYAKVASIAKVMLDPSAHYLSARGSVTVDERTNQLCVQDTAPRVAQFKKMLQQFDVPVQQVKIEARLANVDTDEEQKLGIDFTAMAANASPSTDYNLLVVKLPGRSVLDVRLAALEKNGKAELISCPTLFTADQQPAAIEAGEEVPYQETSESGGTAIAFRKAVLGLKVTPQILPGGHILLQLQINQDRPSDRAVLGMPTISTRQISTNILVKNGQTMVLGGIYETNRDSGTSSVPVISRLPLVGALFKQQGYHVSKRELLIFVTPKIIA